MFLNVLNQCIITNYNEGSKVRYFLLNLLLVLCTLFIFSFNVSAHPHKAGEVKHGSSLNSYKIDLSFSSNYLEQQESLATIKLGKKNKIDKIILYKKTNNKSAIKNKTKKRTQEKKHKN